ncbi:hypothetical protein [Mucilaginibacter kameinonensis]|uniref:hypothetical protein n=1 Tax=Mucilaginibacter kameinonensis TaxID=452286 RepID=UPI0013CEC6F2|nr:hypothetical protein [Mucilaginibacter kameinonensis]
MKDTSLNISETTLKRLFGLAISKFSPSLFTVSALAVYCGFEGWDSFCRVYPIKKIPDAGLPMGWYHLQFRAREASDFTLQALKNKSGIPYRQTIAREFMDDYFRAFDESGLTGSVITGPAGYGKTIALCHWLDEQSESSNDVVLFYSSIALMSVLHGGKSIDDWMAFLLGFHTEAVFNEMIDGRENGKFYLVLDGMDDHMFKKEQFHLLLNQLSHLHAFYRQFEWFKLVLTMRSTTWINYKHELESGENKWFTAFRDHEECINMPLFSYREIQLLRDRISARSAKKLSLEQAESFCHPLYFQYYCQMEKGAFPVSGAERILSYELSSLFMLNKVYVGYYAAEKVSLLQQLADMLDFGDEHYQVEKLKVMNILNKYDQAFRELLSAGVLRSSISAPATSLPTTSGSETLILCFIRLPAVC